MAATRTTKVEYTDWDDLRQEIEAEVGQEQLQDARAELHAWLRSYKLAEIRRSRHLTQTEVADAMGLTQGRVSQIERGQVGESEIDTIAKYVAAIGGKLRLVVDFGDEVVQVG